MCHWILNRMSRTRHHGDRFVIRSEIHRVNGNEETTARTRPFSSDKIGNEGTSARTRPFSYDEIMLRRKIKKQSGEIIANPAIDENISEHISNEEVPIGSRSERAQGNAKLSSSTVAKHSSDDNVKINSRSKDDKVPLSREKLVKLKEEESRDLETKSKVTLIRDVRDKSRGGRDDIRDRAGRKSENWLNGGFRNEYEKRHPRYLVEKERYTERNRGRPERELDKKFRNDAEERQSGKEIKRKQRSYEEERSMQKSIPKKHDSGICHDLDVTERKESSEVHKQRHDEEERRTQKNTAKSHDSGKRHDLDVTDKKERKESSEVRNEESRLRKKRSRSREHDKDRGRRSPSPRSHRRPFNNAREHGDVSPHSSKDRFRRHPDDRERNRTSENGSNSQFQRHGGNASGLGGYSPRKRRTEAGVKTPSPPHRSPEKKKVGWDLPPTGANINSTGSFLSGVQAINQAVSSNIFELPNVTPPTTTALTVLPGAFSYASIDSVQLTQATRPMRRLYVENLPDSASEKAITECLNNFLLSSGVVRVPGTKPCISCTINKEKGQALVEFLTPEDASAALYFDGRSFSGSVLKIRRPKDYVDVATGVADKSEAMFDSSSNIVIDSPHKIFIGGISKVISSEMLREIAMAFGPLKTFHFEVNVDMDEPCAFLEYVDQSVTLKACAGLSAMRLGGQMLTVVQATPDAPPVESVGTLPFYGVPEHAKPLLEKPTQVLKLKNVLDLDGLSSLSEPELDEVLEDVRLECARFGTVISVNVVKRQDYDSMPKTRQAASVSCSPDDSEIDSAVNVKSEHCGEQVDGESQEIGILELPDNISQKNEGGENLDGDGSFDDKVIADHIEDGIHNISSLGISKVVHEEVHCEDNVSSNPPEFDDQQQDEIVNKMINDNNFTMDTDLESELQVQDTSLIEELPQEMAPTLEKDISDDGKDENEEPVLDFKGVFEPGYVLVEYKRTEASAVAAHCLHGRLFDDRIVSVEYVDYDSYKARFPK